VPRVAIPEQLVFAFKEWIVEALRQACDDFAKPETRAAVIPAVHLHDRFVAGTLTPSLQIAELVARAADWLHPNWPESVEDADEVGQFLGVARQCSAISLPWGWHHGRPNQYPVRAATKSQAIQILKQKRLNAVQRHRARCAPSPQPPMPRRG
jgi:hypothetical protein